MYCSQSLFGDAKLVFLGANLLSLGSDVMLGVLLKCEMDWIVARLVIYVWRK